MNILTIDDLEFCKKFEREFYTTINFDYKRNTPSKDCLKLAEIYDAVEVSISNDFDLYYQLYGWDCESIVIMNPDIVVEV